MNEKRTATVESTSGKTAKVDFTLRTLPPAERQKLALKGLGIFWGLSVVTVVLPPIHWVTVPGFFLFGIYWSLKKLREHTHFEAFSFSCPECSATVTEEAQVAKNPLVFVCPHCRYNLKMPW